ncbi:MAG: WYL domain-containing transcriptional regulator [Gallionellaceae bacterium]|jgi:predicted DNA-binding transcriptional regulator YafY|nr:WYL domain-containing transcriptional regulator [Gallionellaceae bacterium]
MPTERNTGRGARLEDLLRLINKLRGSTRGLGYAEIQDAFGWERKTTERMLGIIENQFPQGFVKERGDGQKKLFRLRREDGYPPNYIAESEIVALKTALGYIGANQALQAPLDSLAGKLESMLQNSQRGQSNIEDLALVNGAACAPRPRIVTDPAIIETLQNAILACRMVQISYQRTPDGPAAQYIRCPLGFLYGVQNNYLVAAFEGKVETPGHYIVSQIASVEVLPTPFDAKGFDIHKYAEKSFGVWMEDQGGYAVQWRVKPAAAQRARRFVFHPTQQVTEQKDGSLFIEFFADGLKEMVWHLMTWEGQIQPLAPPELIAEFEHQIAMAKKALE